MAVLDAVSADCGMLCGVGVQRDPGVPLMSQGSVWRAAETLDTYPLLPLQTRQPKSSLPQIPAFPSRDIAQGLSHLAHKQPTSPGTGSRLGPRLELTHGGDKRAHTSRRPVQCVPQAELRWMSSSNFFKLPSHQDILLCLGKKKKKKRQHEPCSSRASYLFPTLSTWVRTFLRQSSSSSLSPTCRL